MIPIKDDNPTRGFPVLTTMLILMNIAVFMYEVSLGNAGYAQFITTWSVVPARLLANPLSLREIATVFTSMFMHAGWLHVGGNMLYLWIFGNNVEDRFGKVGFLGFYLVSGVIATAAQIAVGGAIDIPSLGASGAVAGVLAAYVVLYPGASIVTIIPIFFFIEVARIPAILVIGFWFLLQVGNGFASLAPGVTETGGVAWFAHLGGFGAGLTIALVFRAWESVGKRYRGAGWR
ncbi:MAG: rhomboid family intramembrane serine protease [Actinobacteria bacterium HGW-Actinobacteria-6]|nr:MAG: rhomboid family intramembrane serine protease [Actinobacteria bacterium HGW-Actinobacteria-6]